MSEKDIFIIISKELDTNASDREKSVYKTEEDFIIIVWNCRIVINCVFKYYCRTKQYLTIMQ